MRSTSHSESSWDTFWGKRLDAFTVLLRFSRGVVNFLRAKQVSAYLAEGRALEIGCGTATGSVWLQISRPTNEIIALDSSRQAIKIALKNAKARHSRISLIVADLLHLPFTPKSFELVWSCGVMEHFANPIPALQESQRVVSNNGRYVALVPTDNNVLVQIRDLISHVTGLYFDFDALWGGNPAYKLDLPLACQSAGLRVLSNRHLAKELFIESMIVTKVVS